jgi:hypothetical protein
LQTAPVQDLQALRASEQSTLDGYGWVDRPAGVVRIPIARAMELLVQRQGESPQPVANDGKDAKSARGDKPGKGAKR